VSVTRTPGIFPALPSDNCYLYQNFETGRYDPSLPLAFSIAEIFGQPIETMFFPNGQGEGKP
jgi:hypothetical protein